MTAAESRTPLPRLVALAVTLALVLGSLASFGARSEAQAVRRVVFIGDSITLNLHVQPREQYPTLVGRRLRDVIVQNIGTPGAQMTDAGMIKGWGSHRALLSALTGVREPNAVVILLGTNDWHRGHGVGIFADAYRQFIAATPQRAQIICVTPLWRADEGANANGDTLDAYRAAVRDACASHTVLEGPQCVAADPANFVDGVHPSKLGNRSLARAVARAIGPPG